MIDHFAIVLRMNRYLVATTTIWSGASYIYTKDAVKILTQEDKDVKETPKDGRKKL